MYNHYGYIKCYELVGWNNQVLIRIFSAFHYIDTVTGIITAQWKEIKM